MAHNRINENRMIDSETGIKSNLKLLGAANLSQFINIIFSESDSTTFICCRRISSPYSVHNADVIMPDAVQRF